MAKYPEVSEIPFVAPVKMALEWRTLTHEYEGGVETRKQKRLYPRRNFTVTYENLSIGDANTIWNFYNARKGRLEAFNFFMHTRSGYELSYTGEYVGVGDGSTTVLNLPSKNATLRTMYLNGVEINEGAEEAWVFSAGEGEDGADKATFTSAPGNGVKVTFDFTGTFKVRSRFAEDLVDFEIFYAILCSAGLKMRGLLNK